MQFMTTNNYNLISQTETTMTFKDGKDINIVLLILGILFLLIGAILYYLLANTHTITVTITETPKGIEVECATNTTEALKTANNYLDNFTTT